jgi:hypothetical protein
MIEKSTVFVLGAGASWHYGYPTGEELVQQVTNFGLTISSAPHGDLVHRFF